MEGQPTNLNATRQKWLEDEVAEALRGGRWKDTTALVKRVRKRWAWATDREIWSALDALHEAGRIDSRHVEEPAGAGSVDTVIHVTQWKLLK